MTVTATASTPIQGLDHVSTRAYNVVAGASDLLQAAVKVCKLATATILAGAFGGQSQILNHRVKTEANDLAFSAKMLAFSAEGIGDPAAAMEKKVNAHAEHAFAGNTLDLETVEAMSPAEAGALKILYAVTGVQELFNVLLATTRCVTAGTLWIVTAGTGGATGATALSQGTSIGRSFVGMAKAGIGMVHTKEAAIADNCRLS